MIWVGTNPWVGTTLWMDEPPPPPFTRIAVLTGEDRRHVVPPPGKE